QPGHVGGHRHDHAGPGEGRLRAGDRVSRGGDRGVRVGRRHLGVSREPQGHGDVAPVQRDDDGGLRGRARVPQADDRHDLRLLHGARLETTPHAYLATLADNAPLSVRGSKAAIQAYLAGWSDENRARMRALQIEAMTSEDYREGTRAFLEKRRPTFQGR